MNLIKRIASWFRSEANVVAEQAAELIETEKVMEGTQAAAPNVTAVANVNTAIQIALAIKAIDSSLSVEAVQAGTNAALAALYPVAAAA